MGSLFIAMGWLPVVAALAALAGGYAFARRRAFYQPRDPANERTDRIWHSAALFTIAAIAIALLLIHIPTVIGFLLVYGSIFGVAGLLLIIVIDLIVVKPLEAKRTKGWMIAAPAIFAFVFLGFLLVPLAAWSGAGGAALLWTGALSLLGDAAAAGFVWWAYLPLEAADIRRTFE